MKAHKEKGRRKAGRANSFIPYYKSSRTDVKNKINIKPEEENWTAFRLMAEKYNGFLKNFEE